MKLSLPTFKPRNPLVAAALQRRAGSHRRSAGAQRQQDRQALHRELQRERPSP